MEYLSELFLSGVDAEAKHAHTLGWLWVIPGAYVPPPVGHGRPGPFTGAPPTTTAATLIAITTPTAGAG